MKFPMFCKTPSLGKRGDLRGGLEQTLVADSTYTVRVAALGAGQSSWFSPGEARFGIQVFRGRGGVVVAQAERSQRECAALRDILAHTHGWIAVPEPPRGGGLLPGGGEAKAARRVRDWCFRLLQTPELTSDPHTSRFFGGLLEDSAAPEEQGGALQRAQSDNVLVRQRERTRVKLPRQRSANQLFRSGASHAFAAPPEVPAAVAEAPPAVREQEGLAPATPHKGTTPALQGVHLVGGGVAHEGHLWFGAGGGGGGGSPLGGAESSSRASLNTTLSGREGALSREGMLSAKTTVANTPMATDEDIRTALLKSAGHIEWDSGESLGASPEPPPRSLDAPDLSRLRTLLVDILPRTSSAETRETDLSEEPPSGARTGRTAYTYSLSRSQSADPPTWRSGVSVTEYAASDFEGPPSPLLRSTGPLVWGDEVLVDEAAAAEACGGGHLASLASLGPLLCPSLVASCEVF